jgi:uncharacterized membrane protein
MKLQWKVADAAAIAFLVGTFALTAALYPSLPERIPTHFDLHGIPNGWMPRSTGAWFLPLVALGVGLLLRFGAIILPPAWRARLEQSPTASIVALVSGFLCALQGVILYAALSHPFAVATAINLLLGGLWIALGLTLPRVRRNPWIGVRTPWTLSSDENWSRTHRFAGYTFTMGGVIAVLFAALSLSAISTCVIVVSALMPIVQSYRLARHENEA